MSIIQSILNATLSSFTEAWPLQGFGANQGGKCFTYNFNPKYLENGCLIYQFRGKALPTAISLHAEEQFMNPLLRSQPIELTAGDEKGVNVQFTFMRNRNTEAHECAQGKMHYNDVLTDEAIAQMKRAGNCSVPYINRTGSGVSICTDKDSYQKAYLEYIKLLDTNQPLRGQQPPFPPPCNFMSHIELTYEVRKHWKTEEESYWSNHSEIWIRLPARITVQEQVQAYTPLSFFAEVGGYVGLFLGLSVLQLLGYMGQVFQHFLQKLRP